MVDNEISSISWIIVGIFLGIFVIAIVVSRVLKVPITGTVLRSKEDQPFSAILKLCMSPKIDPDKYVANNEPVDQVDGNIPMDQVDGNKKPVNVGDGEGNEETESKGNILAESEDSCVTVENGNKDETKKEKIPMREQNQRFINVQEAECIYIEMVDSESSESVEEDAVDGNRVDKRGKDNAIKTALNIDNKKHIRIVTKIDKKKLIKKRR